MTQTVVGVFESDAGARQAEQSLQRRGFDGDSVRVSAWTEAREAVAETDEERRLSNSSGDGFIPRIREFFAGLVGEDHHHMPHYQEAVRHGAAIVRVDVEDAARLDEARLVLESAGAIDIEDHAHEWGLGNAGHESTGGVPIPAAAAPVAGVVNRGSVRVYARDSAPAGTATRQRAFEDDEALFRIDYETHYVRSGVSYDDFRPAYRYGHEIGRDARYSGRDWSELEDEARTDWERRHPHSAWETFKSAVRRGWQRVS